jgi:ketosteroid isomerase-like protein
MKKTIFVMFLVAAFCWTAVAQKTNDEAAVGKFMDEIAAALGKNDAAALEKLYDADYSVVSPTGKVMSKAERVNEVKTGAIKYDSYVIDDRKIRVRGNTAVVVSTVTMKGKSGDADISGQYRITGVLMKEKEGWKLIAAQSTRISPAQ